MHPALKAVATVSAMLFFSASSATAAKLPGNVKSSEAVQIAASGKLKTVNAAWWGFDAVDATDAIQSAINSGARKVVVPNMGKDWIVRPIRMAGNQEILFEKGVVVTAKKGEFKGTGDCLFRADEKKGITLRGYGAVLRMQKDDYMTAAYQKGEWRMVIGLYSCADVKIFGLTLKDSGGDGIYLGVTGKTLLFNENILIRDVVCENNYRQGISVISAKNLRIERCLFRATGGTAPEAGIDLEPNYAEETFENCVIRDCRFENNHGPGILLYLVPLKAASKPLSVTFENCTVTSERGGGIYIGSIRDDGPAGYVRFKKCTVEDVEGYGLTIRGKSADCAEVRFDRCAFRRVARRGDSEKPIMITARETETKRPGGIVFSGCTVEDDRDRPFLIYSDNGAGLGLHDVKGTFSINNPFGARFDTGPSAENVEIEVKKK